MEALSLLFAGGTAAKGVGFLGLSAGKLEALGQVVSLVSGLAAISYQASVLQRQAEVVAENARHIRAVAHQESRDKDFEALVIMGQENSRAAASGFEGGSTSFLRRQNRNRLFAQQDRRRIFQDADRQAKGLENEAAGLSADARATKLKGIFNIIGSGLDLGSTLATEGTFVNERTARKINRKARGVR